MRPRFDRTRLPSLAALKLVANVVDRMRSMNFSHARMYTVLARHLCSGMIRRLVDDAEPLAAEEVYAITEYGGTPFLGLGSGGSRDAGAARLVPSLPLTDPTISNSLRELEERVLSGTASIETRMACLYILEYNVANRQ